MRKLTLYLTAIALIFLAACNSNSNENNTSADLQPDTLTYTIEKFYLESKLESKAIDSVQDKTFFEATYPHFQNDTINNYIKNLINFNDNPDMQYNSMEEAGQGFIKEYEDYQKLDYSSPWPWYKQLKATVVENHKSYLGIKVNYEDFMGGAHGNHGIIYSNFNLNSKKEITIQDIILDNKMDSLTLIAEEIFKKDEGIDSIQNSFPNYFFEDGQFSLNNNFLLQKNSILFLYNIYEIKAYVEGVTRLEIPYSKINNMLTPEAKEMLGIK